MGKSSEKLEATISEALSRAALDNGSLGAHGTSVREMSRQEMAKYATHHRDGTRIGTFRRAEGAVSPTLTEVVQLARLLHLSLEEIVDRCPGLFPQERSGVTWRASGVPRSTRAAECRIAAAHALAGASQQEMREAISVLDLARKKRSRSLDEAALRDLVQSGLDLALVRIETRGDGAIEEFEDPKLAAALTRALEQDAKVRRLETPDRGVRVRVVKNVMHPSFAIDPVVPFLIARVAHGIVAEHLVEHATVYSIGLAGGMHCSTFVSSAGAESSPFPDDSGDKRMTFVPLTLEPFPNHQLPLSDAVVGRMVARARDLLGARRAKGLTFQSFRFLVDEKVVRHDDHLISQVRNSYRDLDIAIFGCGDLERDGWLESVLRAVRPAADVAPTTDVCLNLLAEDGSPLPLSDRREFVGISLPDIRRLVQSDDRLALLLTSGPAKGKPIVVAARAGCADTIICDQAAAKAALEVLAQG